MKRILVIIAVGIIAGTAGFVVLRNLHLPATPEKLATPSAPAKTPADIDALKARANSGDAAAATGLGWAYEKGDGVKPDMKAAVQWFQQAADRNDPEALAALGEMKQAGQGVNQDLADAARLFRLAAEKGNLSGQYDLAYLYEQGLGVQKNQTEAAKWYQLAAEAGDPAAQYDIGQRYLLGVGVSTNLVQAFKWLALAAGQGQTDSSRLLQRLQSQMSSADVAEGNRLATTFVVRNPLPGPTNGPVN